MSLRRGRQETSAASLVACPMSLLPGTKRAICETSLDQKLEGGSALSKRIRVVGLKNLGNTCYNNAVIQALNHTRPLREFFLKRNAGARGSITRQENVAIQVQAHTARPRTRRVAQLEKQILPPKNVNLCNEFSNLLKLMAQDDVRPLYMSTGRRPHSQSIPVVSPHEFAGAVSIALPLFQERYEQQDAQEFLRCTLQHMQEELLSERYGQGEESQRDEDTVIQRVFGGILWNEIRCLSCDNYTTKPDPFLDLSLVIPEILKSAKKVVSLEDCIELFSSAEELERSPSPPPSASSSTTSTGRSCHSCGADGGFSKAFKFGKLPPTFCIHLKRFRWKRNSLRGGEQKVDTHVKFPLENLDMSRWLGEVEKSQHGSTLYDLNSVIVHQGTGANSGHYITYIKRGEQWYSLSDDRGLRVPPETVTKAKAYMLFYCKRADDQSSDEE